MIPEQTIEFRYDTQLLIDGYEDLDEDEVFDYIANNFKGDSLLAVKFKNRFSSGISSEAAAERFAAAAK